MLALQALHAKARIIFENRESKGLMQASAQLTSPREQRRQGRYHNHAKSSTMLSE
jgi:hypothetical protein